MSSPPLIGQLLRSSGRVVRNRLIATPGPDPASPAAHLRAPAGQAGQPVAASTAACDERLGGGPAHDIVRQPPRPQPGTGRRSSVTPHIDITITQRENVARRARRVSARTTMAPSSEPRVALSKRSKLAPKSRAVSFIAFVPIPGCRGAASCRPSRSWHLGRRLGRVPALPYPPPRSPEFTPGQGRGANPSSFDWGPISWRAVRRAWAAASFLRRSAQICSARPASLSAGVT